MLGMWKKMIFGSDNMVVKPCGGADIIKYRVLVKIVGTMDKMRKSISNLHMQVRNALFKYAKQ